jgi:phospholipid/cholesterol/gamma-HCH transport system substrate-binding protein
MALEANKFKIGLFFSIGSLLFITGMVWLTGGFREKAVTTYVSYYGWSVQGLNTGSNVMYNGVPIGRVSGIEVAPDGRLVQVKMEINSSFEVDETITAAMQLVGITGLKVINLSSDSTGLLGRWGLSELAFDPPHQVIPVEAGTMESMTSGLERLTQIMNEIDFKEINDQTVSLLRNLNTLFDAEKLDSLFASIGSNSRKLDILLVTYNRLGLSLLELSRTMNREAPEFADDIQRLAVSIEQLAEPIDFLITATDEMVNESGALIRDLRGLVRMLRDNPTEFLLPRSGEDIWQ